jgi:hypothetical protein
MGLSNILPGGEGQGAAPASGAAPATGDAAPAKSPDFGQRLGNYFESKYPIAGGLAQAVFGGGDTPVPTAQPATAPLAAMPQAGQPDYSMLAMNAQPQQGGGGLAALLKLFA